MHGLGEGMTSLDFETLKRLRYRETVHDEVVGQPEVETPLRFDDVAALNEGGHVVNCLPELQSRHRLERGEGIGSPVLVVALHYLCELVAQVVRSVEDLGVLPDFDIVKDKTQS